MHMYIYIYMYIHIHMYELILHVLDLYTIANAPFDLLWV